MAFEDGYNRTVTVTRRSAGAWITVADDVECRITDLKLEHVQGLGQDWSLAASHRGAFAVDADVIAGDRVTVTAARTSGWEWSDRNAEEMFEVARVSVAEGGAGGPHHITAELSRAVATR